MGAESGRDGHGPDSAPGLVFDVVVAYTVMCHNGSHTAHNAVVVPPVVYESGADVVYS